MFGDFLIAGSSPIPQRTSPANSTSLDARPILRRLSPVSEDHAVSALPSRKQSRKATFVGDLDVSAQQSILRPGQEAMTPAVPSTTFASPVKVPPSLGPAAQLQVVSPSVKKFRAQVAELTSSSELMLSAPPITISRRRQEDLLMPILRLPNDPLLDAQVAMCDISMREKMMQMEALLHKPLKRVPTKSDDAAEKFRRNLEDLRARSRPEHTVKCLERREPSPTEKMFRVPLRMEDKPRLTGVVVRQQREEQREAQAELLRLEKDPVLRTHRRNLVAMERMQQQAEAYTELILEQEEQTRLRAKGHSGNQKSTSELIDEWRESVKDVEFTEQMLEQRERQRAIRRIEKEQRYRVRVAMAILAGKEIPTSSSPPRRDGKKRWRVTKIGSVDAFAVPRWSSNPVYTFPGDAVLEEEESTKVGNVQWIRTLQGWVAVHVVFAGYSKTQLFAESVEQLEGEGAAIAMLDEFDDSCDKVEKAYLNCPPEALKSMDEMKDLIFQQEFARQIIRELPAGHHDLIKQTWEEMQRKSRLKLGNQRAMRQGASGLNDEESGDDEK